MFITLADFDFMWGGGREHGDKSDGCERNASVYHVYHVSRTTGEERAENFKGVGVGGGVGGNSNRFRGRIYVPYIYAIAKQQ